MATEVSLNPGPATPPSTESLCGQCRRNYRKPARLKFFDARRFVSGSAPLACDESPLPPPWLK